MVATSGEVRRLKGAMSDQAGYFEIKDLAPGEYRVLAFENLESGAAEDDEFMKRFTEKSKLVTIKERVAETVEATAISADLSQTR